MAEVQKTVLAGEMAQKFVQFVMLQAQNILFVLGKIPTPEGEVMPPNLQAAKMLIDQLEMIQFKTQGNLSAQEAKILADTLTNIHMAFVEATGNASVKEAAPSEKKSQAPVERVQPEPAPEQAASPSGDDDDEKKKYFKSYG